MVRLDSLAEISNNFKFDISERFTLFQEAVVTPLISTVEEFNTDSIDDLAPLLFKRKTAGDKLIDSIYGYPNFIFSKIDEFVNAVKNLRKEVDKVKQDISSILDPENWRPTPVVKALGYGEDFVLWGLEDIKTTLTPQIQTAIG